MLYKAHSFKETRPPTIYWYYLKVLTGEKKFHRMSMLFMSRLHHKANIPLTVERLICRMTLKTVFITAIYVAIEGGLNRDENENRG